MNKSNDDSQNFLIFVTYVLETLRPTLELSLRSASLNLMI